MSQAYLDLHHFAIIFNFFPGGGLPDPPSSLGSFTPLSGASLRLVVKILHFHKTHLEALFIAIYTIVLLCRKRGLWLTKLKVTSKAKQHQKCKCLKKTSRAHAFWVGKFFKGIRVGYFFKNCEEYNTPLINFKHTIDKVITAS